MVNLGQDVIDALAARPHETVVEDGETALTGAKFCDSAEAVAAALGDAAARPDEPVVVACSNRAEDVAALVGAWLSGAVAVPLHRGAATGTVEAAMDALGARLVVNARPDLETTLPGAGETLTVISKSPPARPELEEAASILFTSGSTGAPKGVMLAHDRLRAKLASIDRELGFAAGDRVFLALQLTFIFGQWVTLLTLLKDGRVSLRSGFSGRDAAQELADLGITRFAAVPTMLRAMAPHLAQAPPYRGDVMLGGELLPATLAEEVAAAWPEARLWDLYGLTETSSCDFIVRAGERAEAAGAIGAPMQGIDHRIDPDTEELQIRSPYAMIGYLDRPDLTEAAFDDGWFRTGDVAEARPGGYVALTGRLKDLINRGGNKVAPVEIERALERHPDIRGALAAGVPDARVGEAIHVFVVQRPGAALTAEEVREWAGSQLERFKRPDAVHFGDALPTGATGKADRGALRRLAERGA